MSDAGFQDPMARPRISLSGARAAYVGPGLDLSPHRNAAAMLAVALRAPFALALCNGEGTAARPGPVERMLVALIPPGTLHHLRAEGTMLFLYLDALSDDHAALARVDLEAGRAAMLRDGGALDVDGICAAFGVPRRVAGDARLAAVVRRLDNAPQDFARIDDAARLAGLSASRFQALFRPAVGMPFRRYRLWRRMAAVMRALAGGETLTQAAHGAGFAGSAHLSASFRAMFGLAPSDLVALGAAIDTGEAGRPPAEPVAPSRSVDPSRRSTTR